MNSSNPISALENGIAIIHSNQLEELSNVVEYWIKQNPLSPLENEIFLVQSNGMGQWLKQSLAKNTSLGIAAAINMQLPSLFIWNAYRAILGKQIAKQQPLAKAPLIWRLYRLLPSLVTQPGFETLASFLSNDSDSRKCYQLAEQLAVLFDQYQVYRSDWLTDWTENRDILRNTDGREKDIPANQRWQPTLWREILKDFTGESTLFASRDSVHTQFMTEIDNFTERPAGIPRRIILFGLSSLPQQSLEALAKLGKFCQIVLFIHNPCQHYWADIIEDKELLKAERHRQSYKPGMSALLSPEELHLYASPLLAAWGKQSRDYIRLLDQFDETQAYANWHWPENKIDLFKDYGKPGQRSLLQNLQQSILDLEPLPSAPILLPRVDQSIEFHLAHSPQREVEILHNQLLASFEKAQHDGTPLLPRDVIVMVPDINTYAPHILAVFGRIQADDPRYIPFTLADQKQRGHNPMLVAVEMLLNLPESRFAVSELLGLLEVPALRTHFDITETAIQKIQQWIEQTGIRWGLNAEQRNRAVDMPKNMETNTWQFGLRRMLLGYAVGAGQAFDQIDPYQEIGGLDAQWLGSLSFFLETLEHYADLLKEQRSATEWQQILLLFLDDFFTVSNEQERKILDTLSNSLTIWQQNCEQAGLTSDHLIPINIVREAWFASVDEPSLQQRFLSGRVNFCTLMPMRAIPFRQICLLGMNDGDYPRIQAKQNFDLMSERGFYRPGDRSRRQDDLYMFLEAILSARETLYISWVARSIRDNSDRPPSVLIGQLRDVLSLGWAFSDQQSLLKAISVEHPLQPFSQRYVSTDRDPRLFSYAYEWFKKPKNLPSTDQPVTDSQEKFFSLSLEALARFLKAPVKTFCNNTLKYGFDDDVACIEDSEPFNFNALQSYLLSESLLKSIQSDGLSDTESFLLQQQKMMAQKGMLPLAGFAQASFELIAEPALSSWKQYQSFLPEWPTELEAHIVQLPPFELSAGVNVQLNGNLSNLRRHNDQQGDGLIYLTAQSLINKGSIKYPNLLLHWVCHLAACADNRPLQTIVIASDSVIEISPIEQAQAYELLQLLVKSYYQGMRAPLPIACKTAFAWLSAPAETALEKAISKYQGDDWNKGEVNYDAYLTRFFPAFSHFNQTENGKDFSYWADKLYRPAFDHIKYYQTAEEAQ